MKTWKECCSEIGYDPRDNNPPVIKTIWCAYKAGEVTFVETRDSALKISKNIESIQDIGSKKQFDNYWAIRRALEAKAVDIWYNELCEEFDYLPKEIVDACYSEALDRNNGSGYDECYNQMCSVVEFTENILRIAKKI